MKRTPEYVEGTEAFTRFQNAMKAVLAVPHDELKRRLEAEEPCSTCSHTLGTRVVSVLSSTNLRDYFAASLEHPLNAYLADAAASLAKRTLTAGLGHVAGLCRR